MKISKAKEIAIIGLFVFAVCIIVLLLLWGFTAIESISSFMSKFNKLFLNISSSVLSAVVVLIGVFLGWFLANRTQQKMLKVTEIRNELEKAYGTLYSIVSKPEEMVKIDEKTDELRVVVSEEEKHELDRILISYPHMFQYEIVVLWRTQIRGLKSFRTSHKIELASHPALDVPPLGHVYAKYEREYPIPLEFKDKITKEYERRLEDYYKITGRGKSLEGLPKLARA